jgi:hypothetical protein
MLSLASYGMVPRRHIPAGVKVFDTMNARAESIAEKRSFAPAWLRTQHGGRCALLRGGIVARMARDGWECRDLLHPDHHQRRRASADEALPQAGRRKARAGGAAAGRRGCLAGVPQSGTGAQLPAALSGRADEGVGGAGGAAGKKVVEKRLTKSRSRPPAPACA